MTKPVCVSCQRFYRPHVNGVSFIEAKPKGGHRAPPGNTAPDLWEPYKIWLADLWRCEGCGHLLISGTGLRPISEQHYENWEEELNGRIHCVTVNDC